MENQCDITSPQPAKGLPSEMKTVVHDTLQQNIVIAPHVVFDRICSKIAGPPPLESQVKGYMRRWRDRNRDDSMDPPSIGDASDSSPFRIGLTSYWLLEQYIAVQRDPRYTTILHVDSTHNMVRQRYNVFILGISDACGHSFPVMYYCAYQCRAEDVTWFLAYIKRVMLRLIVIPFAPQFIMTDADKAQHLYTHKFGL
ncbi:hypothetical protein PHMEG_0008383, partial [Phytophthora megakarya]